MGFLRLVPLGSLPSFSRRIRGNVYAILTVTELTNAINGYLEGVLSLSALRVFLAGREALEIRKAASQKRLLKGDKRELMVCYRKEELEALTGLSARSVGKSLKELERAGVMRFSSESIGVESLPLPSAKDLLHELRGERSALRPVPIPRAFLKRLSKETSGSLILTALAYCMRGLSISRDGKIKSSGTLKASSIAETFGLSLRSVQYAREALIREGIISGDETKKQWRLNRFGAFFEVNTSWKDSKRVSKREGSEGSQNLPVAERVPVDNSLLKEHEIAPLVAKKCVNFAPPYRDKKPYFVNRNQKPSGNPQPPTGVFIKQEGKGIKPNLRAVTLEDLNHFSRTEALYFQAVKAGWVTESENSLLNFIAAAVRAKTITQGDPVKVFMGIVKGKLFTHITQAEEERARAAIRKYRYPTQIPVEIQQLVA